MRTTTHTFQPVKGRADYTCHCSECGKTLRRTAVVEHTINPFNKNAEGVPKVWGEVLRDATRAADAEAAKLQDQPAVCSDCADAPNRRLLLEMATEPEKAFPEPEKFWGSPMHVLLARKQVDRVHVDCACGSDCCSGYKRSPGYRITANGLKRAAKFREKDSV